MIWFCYMTLGGKQEFERLYSVHIGRAAPNLSTSRVIECDGRLLEFVTHTLLAVLVGGYMQVAVEFVKATALACDKHINVEKVEKVYAWCLVAFVVSGWTVFAGKIPHTTWSTRFCMRVVEKVCNG